MNKKINKIILLSIFSCCIGSAYAQTGIGTSNPQGALHIDGAKDNAVTGIPTTLQVANDVIISKTTGFIGVGVLNPQVKLDMRSADTENALGLGTTTMTATAAGAGAVRYDVVNAPVGAKIEVSDGSVWNKAYVAPQKAVVVVRKITSQSISQGSATTIPKFITVNSYPAFQAGAVSNYISGNCNAIFNLKKDDTIKFSVKHNIGSARNTLNDGKLNNLSISEL